MCPWVYPHFDNETCQYLLGEKKAAKNKLGKSSFCLKNRRRDICGPGGWQEGRDSFSITIGEVEWFPTVGCLHKLYIYLN